MLAGFLDKENSDNQREQTQLRFSPQRLDDRVPSILSSERIPIETTRAPRQTRAIVDTNNVDELYKQLNIKVTKCTKFIEENTLRFTDHSMAKCHLKSRIPKDNTSP